MSRIVSIKLISSNIIEHQLGNLSKFIYSNTFEEFYVLLLVMKINFLCLEMIEKNNTHSQPSTSASSFGTNQHFYEAILKALQRYTDHLLIKSYQIESGNFVQLLVYTRLFCLFFLKFAQIIEFNYYKNLKIWSNFFEVIDHADVSFKPNLEKFVEQYCWKSLKSVIAFFCSTFCCRCCCF